MKRDWPNIVPRLLGQNNGLWPKRRHSMPLLVHRRTAPTPIIITWRRQSRIASRLAFIRRRCFPRLFDHQPRLRSNPLRRHLFCSINSSRILLAVLAHRHNNNTSSNWMFLMLGRFPIGNSRCIIHTSNVVLLRARVHPPSRFRSSSSSAGRVLLEEQVLVLVLAAEVHVLDLAQQLATPLHQRTTSAVEELLVFSLLHHCNCNCSRELRCWPLR